jgi:hypothetical protein
MRFRLHSLFGFAPGPAFRRAAQALLCQFALIAIAHAQSSIVLGNAALPLTGPWKFHTGDNMAWAQQDFDDSAWGEMDLAPPPGSFDPFMGRSGFVPGWTARGYAGFAGYAWYRLRVDVHSDGPHLAPPALALKMPYNIDDAYQVYVNGRLSGEFGRFTPHGVTTFASMPRAFRLPSDIRTGPVTIAIRFWMSAATPLLDQDVGGMHGPPALGESTAIQSMLRLEWEDTKREDLSGFIEAAILLLALVVASTLFWLDRSEPAFLWLGLTCAARLIMRVLLLVTDFTTWVPAFPLYVITDAILLPILLGLWVIFWAYWFRLERMDRLHRMVWSLVLMLIAGMALLRPPLYGGLVPASSVVWLSPLTLALKLLLGALLVWVTWQGIRRDKAEGWLALPAVALVALAGYHQELFVLHLPTSFFPFGYAVGITEIAIVLSLNIITVLLLRRFFRSQRERNQWRLEIEQARQVQQVLIPEAIPSIPGFTVESEYRPARLVGGDFFQIIPHPADGSFLIVAGDVTGKGLKAGMLVALLVGAIRSTAETNAEPGNVLAALNRRLLGRGDAQATCLAVRIAPDGEVILANAGHLPPYLNREPVAMEGALPLGMIDCAEFSAMQFQLHYGDKLVLMSDGIPEATDAEGNLFGFERVHDLLRAGSSAAEVASAAQSFGQADDISVISVTRTAAMAPAAA